MRITISPQAPLQTRPTTYVRTCVPTIAPCQLTILYYAFAHFTAAGKVFMHAGLDSRMIAFGQSNTPIMQEVTCCHAYNSTQQQFDFVAE